MKNLINILKTTKWLFIIAIVIAIVLLFVNPMYTIIFCVSGLMGFGTGLACVKAFIPSNFDEWKVELEEFLDKAKNNDINIKI